jgi:hypothetical protein
VLALQLVNISFALFQSLFHPISLLLQVGIFFLQMVVSFHQHIHLSLEVFRLLLENK